jgi:phosphoribosylformylglycinamidine synthase
MEEWFKMKKEEIKICIMRVPGTNRDYDVKRVFDYLGVNSEIVRLNKFTSGKKSLLEYHSIIFPGGFAHGDRIRSGAIWAKTLIYKLQHEVKQYLNEGRPILGICNGMQVLVESGLIPGLEGMSEYPHAAMATNASAHFECRWVYLKNFSRGNCLFTSSMQSGQVFQTPVCHGEGRFLLQKNEENKILKELEDNDQIVFRYCDKNGEIAKGKYPTNPNGAFDDIAGVCNPDGNILAFMPHAEDASFWYQFPDWSRTTFREEGEAINIFKGLVNYLIR